MKKFIHSILGRKVGNTRVVPVVFKIVLTFVVFILVSNLSSNYINLTLNQMEQVKLLKQLLVKDLQDLYGFCNNQYEISRFNKDITNSILTIEEKSKRDLKNQKAIALGLETNGNILFYASQRSAITNRYSGKALEKLNQNLINGVDDGFISFDWQGDKYFGVYKFNNLWNAYVIRAEELNEFYAPSRRIFKNVSIIILIMSVISAFLGIFLLRIILRFVHQITGAIMNMIDNQKLGLIDLDGASNDDVTYLGASFNSLSSTINNLLAIFRKFVSKDTAIKAYRENEIRLEGTQKQLTILFSDIKSFTFISETLGTDIINLLNIHYNNAIREIIHYDGIIGSIIGDALLAVFGTLEEQGGNKSFQAVMTGYRLQEVAQSLRNNIHKVREEITAHRGALTETEERVYKACLLEIGVGIDGGNVFYGNIGSYERMTNTVIGDNVNSASRLEGLTRIYKIPVICSLYVKEDIENNVSNHGLKFFEIDQVQVKGKTIGKKIFWPIFERNLNESLENDLKLFSEALQYYYEGKWKNALAIFKECSLPMCKVFRTRTENNIVPSNWSGIWTMKTK